MDKSQLNRILTAKPSQIARALLTLKGKPLNLDDYLPFQTLYDIAPPELTIMASRQIGKSVSMAASTVSNGIMRPFFTTLYIAPLSGQTSRFSSAYIDPFLASPVIRRHFVDSSSKKNVFQKSLNNGSTIYLAYAMTEQDADRVRGASADQMLLDEMQDLSYEAIPILGETLSASDYNLKRYTGTAKTVNNGLTLMFNRSSMCEWATKCDHCGKYTIPMDFETCMKMIQGVDGPACAHCGKYIDVYRGKWVAAKPLIKDHLGFHVPQMIIGARTKPKKWTELRNKVLGSLGVKQYSGQKIANEVFGVPSGIGGRIFTVREAMACCNTQVQGWDTAFPRDNRNIVVTVLGVDWSVSGSTNSYTVISILGYDSQGKCYLLYSQKLDSIDILDQVRRVEELYYKFECSIVGSDRGVGVLQGQLMKRHLGDDRVAMCNYVSAKTHLRWDKDGLYYSADRTMNMDTMILKAKMGIKRFETPCWNLTSEFWEDALNVFEEESATGRRLYRKDQDLCDDWLHSVVFANIGYMVIKGDFVYNDEVKSSQETTFDVDSYLE